MTTREEQVATLEQFVRVRRSEGWKLRKTGRPHAVLYVGETPDAGWLLFLMPKTLTDGRSGWYAGVQREFSSRMAAETDGTFDECSKWLEERRNEKARVADAIYHLQDLVVDGRAGWRLSEKNPGQWVAWRAIDVLDQRFTVLIDSEGRHPTWWRAECRDADGNVIAELSNIREEVAAAVHGLSRILGLINTLRECRSSSAAAEVLARLRPEQLALIRAALGLPDGSLEVLRSRIVRRVSPGRFNPADLTHSGRK